MAKIILLESDNLQWIGERETTMNANIALAYNDYEIECDVVATGRLIESHGSYGTPAGYRIAVDSIDIENIQIFDSEFRFVEVTFNDYKKIKTNITNFIEKLL